MKTYVISLERTPERTRAFEGRHRSILDFEIFAGVDGRQLDLAKATNDGYVDRNARFAPGALGNAMSHIALWERAGLSSGPTTICEDDALLHREYGRMARDFLSQLPADWDLIFWGWNFDALLVAEFPFLTSFGADFDQSRMRDNASVYLETPVRPVLLKLLNAFGTLCYSVSPRGARKLLSQLLPLRDADVTIGNSRLKATTVDIAMNAHYASLRCFVTFPPIALSLNDHNTSTVVAKSSQVDRMGRNVPCPCGSGKRYKHCHGALSVSNTP